MVNDISMLRKRAEEAHKSKDYRAAILIYQDLWTNYIDKCNEWDGWRYADSLRRLKDFENALHICSETRQKKENFANINGVEAWCLYLTQIKKDAEEIKRNQKNFFDSVERILEVTVQDKYSPYAKTVLKVVEFYEEPYYAAKVIEWTEKLDSSILDTEAFAFENNDGKSIELASERESWYAKRTKALEKLGRYEECIELCQKALDCGIDKFHYGNEIWFKYRIALSKGALGRRDEAIAELEQLLRFRKEWFIQHKLAEFYFESGEIDQAIRYAVDAALDPDELGKKYRLFQFMGSIFQAQEEFDQAKKHIELAVKLCTEREWSLDNTLRSLTNQLNIDTSSNFSSGEIHKELKRFWEDLREDKQPRNQGVISKIHENGRFGFVRSDDGKSYYFKTKEFKGQRSRLVRNLKVSFRVEPSFDPSKNQETEIAVDLQELKF